MVRVTKEQAGQNRAAIVAAADRQLRRDGYERMATRGVAEAAGLTEGAVFRNFPTKADLGAAAVQAGFAPILALLDSLPEGRDGLERYVEVYLGPDHRDHFPWGCPVGALAGEMHRHPDALTQAYAEGLAAMLEKIARLTGDPASAVTLLATLSGAIGMARLLRARGDTGAADAVLRDVAAGILRAGEVRPEA